ncbi:YciI family protein [Solirubrobacter ginsenosidimutans]|uniref:YciI family protein n=1 Tax=Solirubrobacter ginsenosidimutans TaxID=490573 RepID=A0A9X3MQM0_9ACTN|nr:YciI family protein [Solirubrobacter ginsenosidimutans]MDA0160615.1 YciI family protein [Solirubrobacter ginsenosidimutans]
MRYILLIYQNTEAWNGFSQAEKEVLMHTAGDIVEELSATGEWVGGEGLADASQARSTHVRDGVVTVTDGPFLEAKEALAGYCIVDVATPERAEEIAARWPDALHWGMEIRALMQGGGEEA